MLLNIKVGTLVVLMDLNESVGVTQNIQYCFKQLGMNPSSLLPNIKNNNTSFPYKFKDTVTSAILDSSKSLEEQGYAHRLHLRAGVGIPADTETTPSTTSTAVRTLEIVDADENTLSDPPYPNNRHGSATIPIKNFP